MMQAPMLRFGLLVCFAVALAAAQATVARVPAGAKLKSKTLAPVDAEQPASAYVASSKSSYRGSHSKRNYRDDGYYHSDDSHRPHHEYTRHTYPACKNGTITFFKGEVELNNTFPACPGGNCGDDYNTPTAVAYAKCTDSKKRLQVGGHCEVKCKDISDYPRVYKTADQLRLGFATDNADTAQTYCVAARLAGDGLVSDGGSTQGRFTKWCRFTSVAYCCEPEPYTYRSTRD